RVDPENSLSLHAQSRFALAGAAEHRALAERKSVARRNETHVAVVAPLESARGAASACSRAVVRVRPGEVMKLGFLLFDYFPFGGLQRDCLKIARLCATRGHDVTIFTRTWQGE